MENNQHVKQMLKGDAIIKAKYNLPDERAKWYKTNQKKCKDV